MPGAPAAPPPPEDSVCSVDAEFWGNQLTRRDGAAMGACSEAWGAGTAGEGRPRPAGGRGVLHGLAAVTPL